MRTEKRNEKKTGVISYMSGTNTKKECWMAWRNRNTDIDYRAQYHEEIKRLFNVKYAFSYCAGRASLYELLNAIGLNKGDEVILEGYTCVAVPKAVMYAGGIPVYADINEKDFNITLESVEKRVTERTRAVVVQHTYGIPCLDIFRIKEFCEKKRIILIEDCAHILGTDYKGQLLGTIGDAGFFSTDHSKYICTGVGGFCITNNETIGRNLTESYKNVPELTRNESRIVSKQFISSYHLWGKRMQRFFYHHPKANLFHGYYCVAKQKLNKSYYLDDYSNFDWPKYTFPAKLPKNMALIGLNQIQDINENIEHREMIASIYKKRLKEMVVLPKECRAPLRVPLLINDQNVFAENTRDLVTPGSWFNIPIYCLQPYLSRVVYYDAGTCAVAERLGKMITNLPTHMKVTEKDANVICDRILSIKDKII